jgi:hypothetical protein
MTAVLKARTLPGFRFWNRLGSIVAVWGFALCLATYAVCPCETQDQAGLRLAYENGLAEQNQLLADATVPCPSPGGSVPVPRDPLTPFGGATGLTGRITAGLADAGTIASMGARKTVAESGLSDDH